MIPLPTVLLVEDDPNDALFFQRACAKAGLQNPLQRVRDGEEAIRYLEGEGRFEDRGAHPLPGLIMLDLRLPRRAGFEVLEWMRSRPAAASVPVVVLTSSSSGVDRREAERLRASEYHVKPMDVGGIVELLRSLAGRFPLLAVA